MRKSVEVFALMLSVWRLEINVVLKSETGWTSPLHEFGKDHWHGLHLLFK